jgi:hypothetical protein
MGQAFAAWTAAGGQCQPSIVVIQLAPLPSPIADQDATGTNQATGENNVVFRDDSWPYQGEDGLYELVSTTFQKTTGELLDSNVEINGAKLPELLQTPDGGTTDPTSSLALQRIFLHLAGHFLGFAHSPDPDSIMFQNFSPSDPRPAQLTADDAAGMCAVYPEDGTRPIVDANGKPKILESTACMLGAATATSSCSLHIDHGCSLARPRSASREHGALLIVASFGVCLLCARRRARRS